MVAVPLLVFAQILAPWDWRQLTFSPPEDPQPVVMNNRPSPAHVAPRAPGSHMSVPCRASTRLAGEIRDVGPPLTHERLRHRLRTMEAERATEAGRGRSVMLVSVYFFMLGGVSQVVSVWGLATSRPGAAVFGGPLSLLFLWGGVVSPEARPAAHDRANS